MSFLTSVPRATQLLDKEPAQALLVSSLEQEFKRYLKQVRRQNFRQDRRYYWTVNSISNELTEFHALNL